MARLTKGHVPNHICWTCAVARIMGQVLAVASESNMVLNAGRQWAKWPSSCTHPDLENAEEIACDSLKLIYANEKLEYLKNESKFILTVDDFIPYYIIQMSYGDLFFPHKKDENCWRIRDPPETEMEAKHDCRTQLFSNLLQSKSALWLPAHLDVLSSLLFTSVALCTYFHLGSANSSELS